ncbi:MAG: S9 family peptidase [Prevotella sp.]|nr:S9 family peptidase [Prevotella sp.]MBR1462598.1 S9 family peptidase [Prevotella sp.]
MKKIILIGAALLIGAASMMASEGIQLKQVVDGTYSAEMLRTVTPLADGESYAQISSNRKQIVAYSYKTGKQTDVLFDVNDTKGQTIAAFDDYILSPDGKKMLIQTHTNRIYRRSFTAEYYIYNIATKLLERLSDGGPQQTPVWSNDGLQVAFVRNNNIFLVKLLYDNAESQVTKDGKWNEIINGIPDWVYEEEFGFNSAMTFNADGTMICWIRFDESQVKEYPLQMFKGTYPEMKDNATYPGAYSYKYPKAGEVNSKVSVLSYDIKSHQTRALQIPLDHDGYIPRIKATRDAEKMIVYTMNRHQDVLNIYSVNPRSTVSQLLIKENVDKYVKEEAMSKIQITDNNLLLPSDRDGHMRLYLYNLNGQLLKKFNTAEGEVTDVYGYDEATGNVYYQSAGKNPLNREVYVTLKNGKTQLLTPKSGWNSAIFSKGYRYFVNQWSDCNTPYEFTTCSNMGKVLATLVDNQKLKQRLSGLQLPKKEFFVFTTSEGVKLNGVMIKPADFNASKQYPVVMWQYSGPGSQQVTNAWSMGSMGSGALYDAYLTQSGFIVVCVDGRGTGGRGADFEKCTYMKLGELEAKDQVETAIYLGNLPYVDKNNIGIWGWSYGGFNTLMSMSEGRPVFKAGVAVAPPTDWRFYDSVYTERYMRTPQENAIGYDINPINRAAQMSGVLLICHGLADDNVHPQNTFEYTEALVQADKDFKMNVYTNRNHSIYGGNTRNHLLRQIAEHFVKNLK